MNAWMLDRVYLSNSLVLAASTHARGLPWYSYLSTDEYDWVLLRASEKYHSTSEFRAALTAEKVLYLLFLARGVRIGTIPSIIKNEKLEKIFSTRLLDI